MELIDRVDDLDSIKKGRQHHHKKEFSFCKPVNVVTHPGFSATINYYMVSRSKKRGKRERME